MAPAHKKRKVSATEDISFDPASREDYLTGFHKRKQARIKAAQKQAAQREKEEKLRQRKELREQRKADLEQHVKDVQDILKKANGDLEESNDSEEDEEGEEWTGFEEPPPISKEDEYVDEDKYTSVTVEEVEVSHEGLHARASMDNHKAEDDAGGEPPGESTKKVWTKSKPAKDGPKKAKKKKFRYESKSERKVTRHKEKSKNRSQAQARRKKG